MKFRTVADGSLITNRDGAL